MEIFKISKAFRSLIMSQFVSVIGDILFYPILLIIASKSSNVGLMTGLVTLSETLPIVIALFVVPRMENIKKRFHVLCGTYMMRFVIYVIVAFLIRQQTDVLLVVILLLNIISDVIGNSTSHTRMAYTADITKELAKDEEDTQLKFSQMSGLNQVVQNVSQLIGLALGGVLLTLLVPSQIAFINALTFMLGMFIMLLARKQFLNYDKNHTIQINTQGKTKMNFKLFFENKRLVSLVFFSAIVNMMFATMMIFNNMYANVIEINHSYETFVFIFFIAGTIGMILGGLLISSGKIKLKFLTGIAIIYFVDSLYFLALFFHLSMLMIAIGFINSVMIGIVLPLLMGELVAAIGTEKIATVAVVINLLLQLLTPFFIILVTMGVQILPIHMITLGMIVLLISLSAAVSMLQLKGRT